VDRIDPALGLPDHHAHILLSVAHDPSIRYGKGTVLLEALALSRARYCPAMSEENVELVRS
jgi:hypothetical protein